MDILHSTIEIGGYTVTVQFLLNIIIAFIALVVVFKVAKKTIRIVSLIVIVVTTLMNMHIISQEDVLQTGSKLKELGITSYSEYKEASDSIKVIDGDLCIISEQGWVKQKDIKDVSISEETATIVTKAGTTCITKDKYVIKLLKTLYNKGK